MSYVMVIIIFAKSKSKNMVNCGVHQFALSEGPSETSLVLRGISVPNAFLVVSIGCIAVDVVLSRPAGQLERWALLDCVQPIVKMTAPAIFGIEDITSAPVLESVAEALEEGACKAFEHAKLFP